MGNKKPKGNIVFASCDTKYFNQFAQSLLGSTHFIAEVPLHIHVMNPTDSVLNTCETWSEKFNFTYSLQDTIEDRTYYSINRFLVTPEIFKSCSGVSGILVVDVDCIFNKKFDFPEEDIGLFLREPLPGTFGWEKEGTHVAAGVVWCKSKSKRFLKNVSENIINHGNLTWFLDQVMLWRTFNDTSKKTFDTFRKFDSAFMDWEFSEDSIMWTGKGDRKYNNTKYIERQNKYSRMIKKELK